MNITAEEVKRLRDLTGAGMMEAKSALVETSGDFDAATEILKARGASIAAKKADRATANGVIASYIHIGNRIGVLVEVNVETDFVARDEKFVAFAKEVALHIAGMDPKYVSEGDIPTDVLKAQDNPATYIKETCLLNQLFVRDPSKTVADLLNEQIGNFKENITIRRFVRMQLGSE
ncbi:MAG: translation elongation factor Ts [bacterium]